MISAIDTNILLDIFLPDERFAKGSKSLLRSAYDEGALVLCDVAYAELVPKFADRHKLDETLSLINVTVSSLDTEVAYIAGEKWKLYRKSGGKRSRIITDFLIGAHALLKADRFLTRDRGFYRSYFPELSIMNP